MTCGLVEMLPEMPDISNEQLDRCRKAGDFCPVLFEWYKYAGLLACVFASLRADSPAISAPQPRDYAVLVGLFARASRLMLANVALSHNGLFGETTAIVDRCIFESAMKAIWLCETDEDDRFDRFVADGLRTELAFKESILANIAERSATIAIEARMLDSIDRMIASSGMSVVEIEATRRLPDLASMIQATRRSRLLYVVGQKMGSHHVHGTWPSLLFHYLSEIEGVLAPRDHESPTHVNQYVFIPLVVLDALRSFTRFIAHDPEDQSALLELIQIADDEIQAINKEVVGEDFARMEDV